MLAQVPDDGNMGARSVVEGAHMGYGSADALMEAFKRAKLSDDSIKKLDGAFALDSHLVWVGILTLDSQQLRELGFQTLARMVDVPRIG
jgi:hypothetical protein